MGQNNCYSRANTIVEETDLSIKGFPNGMSSPLKTSPPSSKNVSEHSFQLADNFKEKENLFDVQLKSDIDKKDQSAVLWMTVGL